MPFSRSTLTEITNRVKADIERHSGQDASTRGSVYGPFAHAIAGLSHGLHGHIAYLAKQLFDTSSDEEYLKKRAAEFGLQQIAAASATGTVTATGNDGTVISEGTVLQSEDEQLYVVTSDVSVSGGSATLQLAAVEPGLAGNQTVASTLRFTNTIANVDNEVTVVDLSGGNDIESLERLRQRLQERKQQPPMGGAAHDFIAWAKAAHVDVTRAWCYPNENGIGTVVVRFATDNLTDVIPTPAHVSAVSSYMDTVRPAGMKGLNIEAPTAKALDITFTRLTPNTPEAQASIEAELKDLLARESEPGETLLLSRIHEAISLATGEKDHRINLADDVTTASGEILVLGAMTWPA